MHREEQDVAVNNLFRTLLLHPETSSRMAPGLANCVSTGFEVAQEQILSHAPELNPFLRGNITRNGVCSSCQHTTNYHEPVELPVTLRFPVTTSPDQEVHLCDLIDHTICPEVREGYRCRACQAVGTIVFTPITTWPALTVFCIARLHHIGSIVERNLNPVNLPDTINFTDEGIGGLPSKEVVLSLQGFWLHASFKRGIKPDKDDHKSYNSISGGHYLAYCKDSQGRWFSCDDDVVAPSCNIKELFRDHPRKIMGAVYVKSRRDVRASLNLLSDNKEDDKPSPHSPEDEDSSSGSSSSNFRSGRFSTTDLKLQIRVIGASGRKPKDCEIDTNSFPKIEVSVSLLINPDLHKDTEFSTIVPPPLALVVTPVDMSETNFPFLRPDGIMFKAKGKKKKLDPFDFTHCPLMSVSQFYKSDPSISKPHLFTPPISDGGNQLFDVRGRVRVCCFNTNSLRSFIRSSYSTTFLTNPFDFVGFSEVQADLEHLGDNTALANYAKQYGHAFFSVCSHNPTYSGTAIMSYKQPSSVIFGFHDGLTVDLEG
jgi:hypothetical protein